MILRPATAHLCCACLRRPLRHPSSQAAPALLRRRALLYMNGYINRGDIAMNSFSVRRGLLAGLFSLCLLGPVTAQVDDTVTTFAAASLTNAVQDIAKAYAATGKPEPKLSFAASSTLAKQIEAGAPVNIFASADQKWMNYLADKDLIVKETRVTPIGNALVLIAPADSAKPVTITKDLDLLALLGKDGKITTGLTDSVPAGIYAKTALTNLGMWDKVRERIVGANSVRAALALVERGEVPYGIVYATDAAISAKVKVVGVFPAGSHPPVEYPFAILKGHDDAATKAFFSFLVGPEAKAIYKKYGFTVN